MGSKTDMRRLRPNNQPTTGGGPVDLNIAPATGSAPQNAIVVTADGLVFDGIQLSRVGLSPDARNALTADSWRALGHALSRVETSIQWLIGDWLCEAENMGYGDGVQIAQELGLASKTVWDYRYVASSVEYSVRTEVLSFAHHKLVASMTPDEQRHWLRQAVNSKWSVSAMRVAIRDDRKPDDAPDDKFWHREYTRASRMSRQKRQERAAYLRRLADAIEAIE